MNERKVDLHAHTNHSDGVLTPHELVEKAVEIGLTALGITDHDTVSAIPIAQTYAVKYGLEIVPGVELSTEDNGREVHMLGYLIDIHSRELNERMAFFRDVRKARAYKIVEKLAQLGVHIDINRVLEIAGDAAVGRPHIARALVEAGYVRDIKEAFDRYIADDGPAYVPKAKMTPLEAMELIKRAGGIPVIAHPGLLGDPDYVRFLARHGLVGVEVWHSEHSPEDMAFYEALADELGLLKTGGSDFHGKGHRTQLGVPEVSYEVLEQLKAWKAGVPLQG